MIDYEAMDRQRRDRIVAENEARQLQESKAAAEAKVRVDAMSARSNVGLLLNEYLVAGVEPPFTNGDGIPTVSLSMLRWQGWTVERVGEVNTLIMPMARPPVHPRKRREDYDGNS